MLRTVSPNNFRLSWKLVEFPIVLVALNIQFWTLSTSTFLRLNTDDSTLIFSKSIYFGRNPFAFSGNPFLDSNSSPTNTFLFEWLIGVFAKALNLTLSETEGMILFLTINTLFFSIAFLLSSYIKFNYFYSFLSIQLLYFFSPILILRPISPGISLALTIFLLKMLDWATRHYFNLKLQHTLPMILGISFLTFSYVFFAMTLTILSIILITYYNRESRRNNRRDLLILLVTSMPVIFYVMYVLFWPNQGRDDMNFRWGVIESHFPGSLRTVFVALLSSLVVMIFFEGPPRRLLLSLFASLLILSNSQILTGKSMEFDSHFYPLSLMGSILTLVIILNHLGEQANKRLKSRSKISSHLFKGSLFLFCLHISVSTSHENRVYYSGLENQNVARLSSIDDLQLKNLPNHLVISAPSDIREEIPLVLNRKLLFSTPGVNFFPMTNYEVLERKVLDDYLQGDSSEFTFENLREVFSRHFINWSQKTRYEKRIFFFKVEDRENTLRLIYDEYLNYANNYKGKLMEENFLKEELDKYGIGAILRDSQTLGNGIRGFICKFVSNEGPPLILCTRASNS